MSEQQWLCGVGAVGRVSGWLWGPGAHLGGTCWPHRPRQRLRPVLARASVPHTFRQRLRPVLARASVPHTFRQRLCTHSVSACAPVLEPECHSASLVAAAVCDRHHALYVNLGTCSSCPARAQKPHSCGAGAAWALWSTHRALQGVPRQHLHAVGRAATHAATLPMWDVCVSK
eukprot:364071-Chlamydomonas_euryale.AAC.7